MRHMFLLEDVFIVADIDVEALVGHQAAFTKGILLRMPQGHEFVVALEFREIKPGEVGHRFLRCLPRPHKFRQKRPQFPGWRSTIKTADLHIDGMDLAAANGAHDRVADLLHSQSAAHQLRMVLRHANRVGIAQEIRQMQHEHVQAVA